MNANNAVRSGRVTWDELIGLGLARDVRRGGSSLLSEALERARESGRAGNIRPNQEDR